MISQPQWNRATSQTEYIFLIINKQRQISIFIVDLVIQDYWSNAISRECKEFRHKFKTNKHNTLKCQKGVLLLEKRKLQRLNHYEILMNPPVKLTGFEWPITMGVQFLGMINCIV